MEYPRESEWDEIHKVRILLLKQDEAAEVLRKELKDKTIALEVAEERIRRLVAASHTNSNTTDPSSQNAKRTTEKLEDTQASPIAVPKPEPASPSRRMVPDVSLHPRQPSINERGLPSSQNSESSTRHAIEVTGPPPISPPILKPEKKSPCRRLIPYVSVPPRQPSLQPPNKRSANDDRSPELQLTMKSLSQAANLDGSKRRKLGQGSRGDPSTSTHVAPSPLKRPSSQPLATSSTSKRSKKEPKTEDLKVFNLPTSITDAYLKDYKPLDISPSPLPFHVPRKLLRIAYGGTERQLLQFIQPEDNPSGPVLRRMVWAQLDMNPLMPTAPGHPGIMFASRHEILSNPPWTVWCRCSETKTATWCYLGEYECELCGTMSAEQFRHQPQKAKEAWADLLIKGKAFDVYVAMRARIALRKHGIHPVERFLLEDGKPETDEEMFARAQLLENNEIAAIKSKTGLDVEPGDIIAAFSSGDEAIDIIRMQCVSYDHVFAQDLQAKFDNYDQLLAKDELRKATTKPKKEGLGGRQSSRSKTGVTKSKEKGKGKAQRETLSEEVDEGELEYTDEGSSSRPRRKSTKWDADIDGRVVVGDAEETLKVDDQLGWLTLESDSELPELTDSDTD